MTGIDYEQNSLLATDLTKIYSLGSQPFASVIATMSASPSNTLEDYVEGRRYCDDVHADTEAATNAVGTQHCVTAAVTDTFGNPVAGTTVYFSSQQGQQCQWRRGMSANGQAQFCYTGTVAGPDVINAFADDTNNNAMFDVGEPRDQAREASAGLPRPATQLVLTPVDATNTVGDPQNRHRDGH